MSPEYFAGFFDGEGTIGIRCERGRIFRVSCQIANTNLPVLVAIQNSFGGKLYQATRYAERYPSAKCQWVLGWWGSVIVEAMLRTVFPHLIVKKAEAELVLNEFLPEIRRGEQSRKKHLHEKYEDKVIDFRKGMMVRLSEMKKVSFSHNEHGVEMKRRNAKQQ